MGNIVCESDVEVHVARSSMSDEDVISAARVSTLGEQTIDAELPPVRVRGLINFLMRDRHGTPFEHNSITFVVRAPIFVAREFMRHRVGWSYNEESGRYRELRPDFYIPGEDRNLIQVGKPGAYTFETGTEEQHTFMWTTMQAAYVTAWGSYQVMLQSGIAREVARMVLPVGLFTTFYATCNARSLMHFLSLRTIDERATVPSFPQREIEMVANLMEEQWASLMPLTHEAFNAHGRVAP